MTQPDRRNTVRFPRGFVQGEAPDDTPVGFRTSEGQPATGLDNTWTAHARFLRPNGTTIDVDPVTITNDQAVITFPAFDETGGWCLEAWATNGTLTYGSDLYVFDVGDPIEPAPGDPPPPGDHFVTALELEALEGLAGGLLPDGPTDTYVVTWQGDPDTGIAVWAPSSGGGGGGGGGQVNTVVAGHGIDVDSATASAPIVIVDETELDISLIAGVLVDGQIPAGITRDTELATAVAVETTRAQAAEALAVPLASKGAPNGVAPLDSGSLIPAAYLPAIAVSDFLGTVASQAAMLALVGQRGDWCIRSDIPATFMLAGEPSSTLSNWKQLPVPTDLVLSVAGRTGVVTLDDLYDALGAAAAAQAFAIQRANHTGTQAESTVTGLVADLAARILNTDSRLSDARTPTAHHTTHESGGTDQLTLAQSQITGLAAALAALAPVASPTFTGDPKAPTPATSDNDTSIATTAFVQAAIAVYVAAQDVEVFKGAIDCSANPNYPAADAGWHYKVSVAGKIGGASGVNVEAGDTLLCIVDGTAAGTQVAVGANWVILQANIDGAVVGPTSATDGHLPLFNGGSGKLLKDGLAVDPDGTLAANSDTSIATQKAVATALAAKANTSSLAPVATSGAYTDLTGKPTLGTAAATNTGTASGNVPTIAQADGRYAFLDLLTAVKTAAYTAADGEFVRLDTTGGGFTSNLPATPRDGWTATYKWDAGTTAPVLATQGSDVFKGGGTTLTFSALTQAVQITYRAAEAIFVVKTSFSKGGLDALYTPAPITNTITSSATPAINVGTGAAGNPPDVLVDITALATAITSMTSGLSGTPQNFQRMLVCIKDNGTPQTITWGSSFVAKGQALPTTTVAGKLTTVGLIYRTAVSAWCCVALSQE